MVILQFTFANLCTCQCIYNKNEHNFKYIYTNNFQFIQYPYKAMESYLSEKLSIQECEHILEPKLLYVNSNNVVVILIQECINHILEPRQL